MANPFYFSDGRSAADTRQLQAILESSDDKSLQQHVSQGHFASWIRHELSDERLADRISQCRSVQQVIDVLHLEHTPKPREQPSIPKPERQPIQDLKRPTHRISEPPKTPDTSLPVPKAPAPIQKQGFLERYNAKEFVIGLAIGVVLGILIYALLGALA